MPNPKRRSTRRTPKRKRELSWEIAATFWSASLLCRFRSEPKLLQFDFLATFSS